MCIRDRSFDSTSISTYSNTINAAAWGHAKQNPELRQVNYMTVSYTHLAMVLSVIIALTWTPSLCAKILKPIDHDEHMGKGGFFGWFNRGFEAITFAVRDGVGGFIHHPLLLVVCYALVVGGMVWGRCV